MKLNEEDSVDAYFQFFSPKRSINAKSFIIFYHEKAAALALNKLTWLVMVQLNISILAKMRTRIF